VDEQRRHLDDFGQQARWDMQYHLTNLLPGRFRHYRSFLLHHPIPAYIGTGLALLRRKAEARRAEALQANLPVGAPRWLFAMRWLGKFGQVDNWLSCLTAAMLPRTRREHDEANETDPQPWLQGEGSAGGDQG
jgi:hypothetical protein